METGNFFSRKPRGKAALPLLENLKKIDANVQCEYRFSWLFLPKSNERLPEETKILKALVAHCKETKERHPRKQSCDCESIYADDKIRGVARHLEFDFYLPQFETAIEFDERQHFTDERWLTLSLYSGGGFYFDVERWRSLCSAKVRDPEPPCRDWQRAFRDSIRDLRARQQGLRLLRLLKDDFNARTFDKPDTFQELKRQIMGSDD